MLFLFLYDLAVATAVATFTCCCLDIFTASSAFAQLTDAVATATLHPCHTLRALLGLEARTKQLPMNVAAPADNVVAGADATSCPAVSVVAAAASSARLLQRIGLLIAACGF